MKPSLIFLGFWGPTFRVSSLEFWIFFVLGCVQRQMFEGVFAPSREKKVCPPPAQWKNEVILCI